MNLIGPLFRSHLQVASICCATTAMTSPRLDGRRRHHYTYPLKFRQSVLRHFLLNPSIRTVSDLIASDSRLRLVSPNTVRNWLNDSERIMEAGQWRSTSRSFQAGRSPLSLNDDVEQQLVAWVRAERAAERPVSRRLTVVRMLQLQEELRVLAWSVIIFDDEIYDSQ